MKRRIRLLPLSPYSAADFHPFRANDNCRTLTVILLRSASCSCKCPVVFSVILHFLCFSRSSCFARSLQLFLIFSFDFCMFIFRTNLSISIIFSSLQPHYLCSILIISPYYFSTFCFFPFGPFSYDLCQGRSAIKLTETETTRIFRTLKQKSDFFFICRVFRILLKIMQDCYKF